MIIAITGASGVGKTTTLRSFTEMDFENLLIFHFDDIGIPDWSKIKDHKKWQRETTHQWIYKIVKLADETKSHIILEGSTEFKFYFEGFDINNFTDYKIILFDCSEEVMKERLIKRGQPELYHKDMKNWLKHLRRQAEEWKIDVIRTDKFTIPEIRDELLKKINHRNDL